MEYLVNETVADQGLGVGEGDKIDVVTTPPRSPSDEVGLENLTDDDAKAVDAETSAADIIANLVQEIENLTKDDAITRLHELEENHQKTYFEIGGVLSAIQKHKWFDPFASLDEWVKKNTAIKRSKARALIQIYDAIVKSGVTWPKVKHLGWTKLNTIAGVLDGENADHWIEMASNRSRAEIKKLVREHLAESAGQKLHGSTPMRVKTFKFHHDSQVKTVQGAIDKAKEMAGVPDEAAALEAICQDYMNSQVTFMPEWLAAIVGDHLNSLDLNARQEFENAINARITLVPNPKAAG